MEISGQNKCYVCGETIRWCISIKNGNNMEWSTEEKGIVNAEAIAIGRIVTSEGNKVQFEVVARCPYCENKNKFETVKDCNK